MRRRRRQERGDHLVGICRGGRRQRRHAGRDRRSRQHNRYADFRPNAEGFYSEAQRVAATFSPTVDVKPDAPRLVATRRRIGIVAQSGGIGFAIYHRAKALGIALSYVVSAGNESDLGAGEFLDYMVQDASTDVILLFIEGIRDVEKFLAAARRAAEIGKPVIVTKVGRSGAGERAAASHTASMAGWSAAYDAVFAKYGFIVSNDLDEAVTIAAVLTTNPMPKGDRVAVLTVSGGAGIWGADTVSMQGLQVPELSESIQAEIRALIPSYGSARNPIDVTAQGVNSGGLQKSIDLLDVSDEVDAILVVLSLSSETRMPFKQAELKPVIDAQNKPIVFYSYTLPSPFARKELAASGRRHPVGADACRRRHAPHGSARPIQICAIGRCPGIPLPTSPRICNPRNSRNSTARRCCATPASRCPTRCWWRRETRWTPRSPASAFRW